MTQYFNFFRANKNKNAQMHRS